MTLHGAIWVDIGSSNDVLPEGTKPLPEPMLTNDQYGSIALTKDQFHRYRLFKNYLKKYTCNITST